MKWRAESPGEPGWYWMAYPGREPVIVRVRENPRTAVLQYRNNSPQWFALRSRAHRLWAGPLPAPEE